MLIALGGLPGTGKTTIARELARRLRAVYLRIDSIVQALRASGMAEPMNDAGYRVAYRVAEDNLRAGMTVIADSVNPLPITREAWRAVAARAGVRVVEIEVTCSDAEEHRRRVESRIADIPGSRLPTWQEVLERDYWPWEGHPVRIDTAGRPVAELAAECLRHIGPTPAA